MKLKDNNKCFVCGTENRYGLHLEFVIDKNNIMQTEFVPLEQHQGFKGIVHGGLIGLILDEIMVNLAWKLGKNAVSAELNIRLKRAAKVGEKLIFRGWIEKEDKKMICTKAEAKDENGSIVATATAKCIRVKE
jgi:uncharacterized protein (TIGR00369 family)